MDSRLEDLSRQNHELQEELTRMQAEREEGTVRRLVDEHTMEISNQMTAYEKEVVETINSQHRGRPAAARPPPSDRMRLNGLFKPAMGGDVEGLIKRLTAGTGMGSSSEEFLREQDKWDAWSSQTGLSRTEAKRRYIEALIDNMYKYANTSLTPSSWWPSLNLR
ncbi:hypothetical protein N657DRAFT_682358 [Parathielavia appendiculata]|uniref:ACB domain-containing protein n=1 Tax=Parathielavia appendiculata TaxID=2587402 RepID=A0AAN6TWL1_9PEZI|nr:hypothetical protein N657DRAFT_682358 [Parathielavia appendiculata]